MIVWELPLKTVSEMNCFEHWTVKSKRHRQQQFFIRQLMARETSEVPLPCVIILTRCSRQGLDDDNLVGAFKWIRDELSELLLPHKSKTYVKDGKVLRLKGRADSDPSIEWRYAQEKSKRTGIRIEIQPKKQQQ